MNPTTKNAIIHSCVTVGISLIFMMYFCSVQNNLELQQQIMDNGFVIPVAQILAFEGYLGYVIVLTVREIKRNRKQKEIKRIKKNDLILAVRSFQKVSFQIIDLIVIFITFNSFFIYTSQNPSADIFNWMNISAVYFILCVPIIDVLLSFPFFRGKLEFK